MLSVAANPLVNAPPTEASPPVVGLPLFNEVFLKMLGMLAPSAEIANAVGGTPMANGDNPKPEAGAVSAEPLKEGSRKLKTAGENGLAASGLPPNGLATNSTISNITVTANLSPPIATPSDGLPSATADSGGKSSADPGSGAVGEALSLHIAVAKTKSTPALFDDAVQIAPSRFDGAGQAAGNVQPAAGSPLLATGQAATTIAAGPTSKAEVKDEDDDSMPAVQGPNATASQSDKTTSAMAKNGKRSDSLALEAAKQMVVKDMATPLARKSRDSAGGESSADPGSGHAQASLTGGKPLEVGIAAQPKTVSEMPTGAPAEYVEAIRSMGQPALPPMLHISAHTERFGDVEISAQLRGAGVAAAITVERPEAASELIAAMPQFKQQVHGANGETVSVTVGSSGSGLSQSNSGGGGGPQKEQKHFEYYQMPQAPADHAAGVQEEPTIARRGWRA